MGEGGAGRVALLLATSTGGVGRHVRTLAEGLVEEGRPVTVLGPGPTETLFGFRAAGARFLPVEIAAGPEPVADVRAVAALRRGLDGSDLVHAHGLRAGLVAALAGPWTGRRRQRGPQRPLVVTWHNAVLGGRARRAAYGVLERVVARAADVTLGASDDLVARALALGAGDVRLGRVAASALPPRTRSAADVRRELGADGRPLVLSVGRLHPQKGYPVLVAAAARWAGRDPAPLVVVAGTGPEEDRLRALVASLRAPVRLLGHRGDVADLLAACDLAVVTSTWEARQLFAQEALGAGRPLVATAVGGLPDLVRDGAVLVPAADVDALDRAVRRLLDHPAEAAALAARGRALAAAWPGPADTLRQVGAVYDELLGRTG